MPRDTRIAVLTRLPECLTAARLQAAAGELGIELALVDPHELSIHLPGNAQGGIARVSHPRLGDDWRHSVILPRLGSLATEYSLSVLHALEQACVPSVNGYAGLMRLRYKFQALVELKAAGIAVPETAMLRAPSDIAPVVEQLGGYPVVLKFVRGSQGVGVVFAPDAATVTSVLEALNLVQYDVMLQRYYPQGRESDLRVLVVGGEPRWAVRRNAAPGAFRANYHRGGTAQAVELTPELASVSKQATAVFSLGLAGVDLVEADGGLIVLEVNGSPGFQTIEECHHVDAAKAILECAAELSR